MKQDFIEKLPPDAQKEFLKLAMKLNEKTKQSKVHDSFLDFVKHVWPEFIEGKHHKRIADKFNKLAQGKIKRLIINMPPRHTKSEFAFFLLLPAWMIGRKPKSKNYTDQLTLQNSRFALAVKRRHLMDSPEYQTSI